MTSSREQQPSASLNSAFYLGKVVHRRFQTKPHGFNYPLYMTALDLDEVEDLNKRFWWFSSQTWAPLQMRQTDYLNEQNVAATETSLPAGLALKQRVMLKAQVLGANIDGADRVVILAQLRCFGIYFSPANFFFIYQGNQCRYMLAEVSNTPWNQRHCYLVNIETPTPNPKNFHVSPFMGLDMEYRWRVRCPEKSTYISIENWNEECLFRAIFSAKRYEMNSKNIKKVLMQWPVVTMSIVKNIYWQALQLFIKGIKYVPYQERK